MGYPYSPYKNSQFDQKKYTNIWSFPDLDMNGDELQDSKYDTITQTVANSIQAYRSSKGVYFYTIKKKAYTYVYI